MRMMIRTHHLRYNISKTIKSSNYQHRFSTFSRSSSPSPSTLSLSEFPPELIRSFCIIAHIDHGKSTLSDRLLELTETIPKLTPIIHQVPNSSEPPLRNRQVLDKLVVERERGITVKAVSVSMFYSPPDHPKKKYLLNLIDTPGHVDFSTEVLRSLTVADAAILLVDSTQGIQSQTLSVLSSALRRELPIIPVLNKIDLPASEPDRIGIELAKLTGVKEDQVLRISAKTGIGVGSLLDRLIKEVPLPKGQLDKPLRAFVFDSWFDHFHGVVSLVKVADGVLKKGDKVQSYKTGKIFQVADCGIMYPEQVSIPSGLHVGQCGWITCGMKDPSQAILGDTFFDPSTPSKDFEPVERSIEGRQSMVFASLFPVDSVAGLDKLTEAIDQLILNDRSVSVQKEASVALGQGFRLGFLGTLHMDVFKQRLSDEYGTEVIVTRPFVPLKLITDGKEKMINNPIEFPTVGMKKVQVLERIVEATIVIPDRYTGPVIELCATHRGEQSSLEYLPASATSPDETQLVKLVYQIPLSEIVTTFHSSLNSITAGYASFDYKTKDFKPAELVRLDIIVNGSDPVDAFATVVHRDKALREGKAVLGRLKGVMRRQVFEVVLQATIGNKVIASERLSAVRKDVTAGLYGGHYERKMKHLNKQKEGKKRLKMMSIGNVELPQEAFSAVGENELLIELMIYGSVFVLLILI
ncbi:P-loop containing nucleoside triphosphate hydrolase protein [Melampsora americana]|nr:P-loop containing nucleoside triphosphate hydrolase protein [Melampsora americana]